jgi:hypothetical protein
MPLRTDVETALDELIAEEEAFKFQALGVVLAKQKWPRLIASERRTISDSTRTRKVIWSLTKEAWG